MLGLNGGLPLQTSPAQPTAACPTSLSLRIPTGCQLSMAIRRWPPEIATLTHVFGDFGATRRSRTNGARRHLPHPEEPLIVTIKYVGYMLRPSH